MGIGKWLIAAMVFFVIGGIAASPGAFAETWMDRIAEQVAWLEEKVAALDEGRAAEGNLTARVVDLDRRVRVLEQARNIKLDERVSIDEDHLAASLTQSVVRLRSRVRDIERDDAPPPPPPGDDQEEEAEEDEAAQERAEDNEPSWPASLSFTAAGSISYEPVGSYYREVGEFLQTGWEGSFHVTVRTRGLEREIKEAGVILYVRPASIFNDFLESVTWRARRRMWNGAKKSWPGLTSGSVAGPVRWVSRREGRRTRTMRCQVQAIVTYVIDKDDQRVDFAVPEWIRERLTGR